MSHQDYDFLCAFCAVALGGQWPEGHVATWHNGMCSNCGEEKALAHHDDWAWPDQAEYPERD